MQRLFILLLMIVFYALSSYSQTIAPSVQWRTVVGGREIESAYYVRQTLDGGYISVTTTCSADRDMLDHHGDTNTYDGFIVKLSSSGSVDWKFSFGDTLDNRLFDVIQASDGGYIAVGSTYQSYGEIYGGYQTFNFWVLKLNADGSIAWKNQYGGSAAEYALSVCQTKDGGYAMVGWTDSYDADVIGHHGARDYWLVRIDPLGKMLWSKCYGGPGTDFPYMVKNTKDNGFIMIGTSESMSGDIKNPWGEKDIWVVKTDSLGTLEWERSIGGSGTEFSNCIEPTSDGGYILSGETGSTDGDIPSHLFSGNLLVTKLGSKGETQWIKRYGGSSNDGSKCIRQLINGSYVVSVLTYSVDGDFKVPDPSHQQWKHGLVGLSQDGELTWQMFFNDTIHYIDNFDYTPDGGFVLSGHIGNPENPTVVDIDMCIVKLGKMQSGVTNSNTITPEDVFSISSNPLTESTTISLTNPIQTDGSFNVYNSLGSLIYYKDLTATELVFTLHRDMFVAGSYQCILRNGKGVVATSTLIVE
ncbi:MAG TPA: hypothetical protein VIX80_06325 [Candidatus Kapabacteria bacterium]